ncbi:MAG: tRNA (adenosine(37)-N6)-threonylcarbamoyltransferase complex dimerization subunit type 1 TsaB [Acidobacteriota bacterium]
MRLDGRRTADDTGEVDSVLAISACGPRLEVALRHEPGATVSLIALAGPAPRSDVIIAAVDLLLRSAGLAPGQLDAVVATRGPGSFTGVRVALATAQGIARGAGIPAHGFSSLLAQATRTSAGQVLAVQPARRGEVYAQLFTRRGGFPEAAGEILVMAVSALADSEVPVIAPSGLTLPAGVPMAPSGMSAAEALLTLVEGLAGCDEATLVPTYVEPPPALPLVREV